MKKFLIIVVAFITVGGTGCLKDVESTNLLATGGTIIEFEYPTGGGGSAIGSGLEYFGGGALPDPSTEATDTATFYVNIAGTNTLSKAISVTIGPDFTHNLDNYSNDSISYVNMPDSLYSVVQATQTIPAGQRQATFQIVFYPSKFNISVSYALPITATSASGYTVSGNFGFIYFHAIGNPLAGSYATSGTRYNYTGGVTWAGPPAAIPSNYVSTTDLSTLGIETTSTLTAHEISLPFSNIGGNGAAYVYDITGSTTFSSISVDYGFDALYSNITTYVVGYTPPSTTTKAKFEIITHYNNALQGAGNDRIVDQFFVQQ